MRGQMGKEIAIFFFFLERARFYFCIVDLQYCVNFCCIAKWFSYVCVCVYILYIHSLLKNFHFHCGLSQNIEYSFLCYTGDLVIQCVCNSFGSANPKLPILLPQPLLIDNHKSVPYVCESISGKQLFSLKGQNRKCPMGSLSRSAFNVYVRQWDKQLSMCDQVNVQLKNCGPQAPDRKSTSSLCIDRQM